MEGNAAWRQHIQEVMDGAQRLFTAEAVENSLIAMAGRIQQTLADTDPVCLTVMNGGMIPASVVIRHLHFPLTMDYIHATRYQGKTRGESIVWKAKPTTALQDRHVLVMDDILDGGITLGHIVQFCQAAGAARVWTAVLLEKKRSRPAEAVQHADFVGLYVDDDYVFGYGMDYHEYLRNMPGIYAVNPRHLQHP